MMSAFEEHLAGRCGRTGQGVYDADLYVFFGGGDREGGKE